MSMVWQSLKTHRRILQVLITECMSAQAKLFALAYNMGNFLRRLVLPKPVKKWSLRTLREKLIKIGAKVISHSSYVIFQMAEVTVPPTLFREILELIGRLRASPDLIV